MENRPKETAKPINLKIDNRQIKESRVGLVDLFPDNRGLLPCPIIKSTIYKP